MFCTSILDLDKAFDDIVNALRDSDFSYVVSSTTDGLKEINSFGKADVPYSQYVDEDKNLYFDFALAGVSKDSIAITRTSRQIEITVKASEEKNKFAYTHKGIKFPKDKDVSIATIDVTDKYELDPKISFENGLLTLKFKMKAEEKPVEIKF